MAWYHQATSHYLNQCWRRSLSPYDVTRPHGDVAVIWQISFSRFRDQSRYAPSQWEMLLQCNDVSHWLGPYLDWSLKLIVHNSSLGTRCEIALRWMSHNLTNDKSILVQLMAWGSQAATSHNQHQCWPMYMDPYVITRPQGHNTSRREQNGPHFYPRPVLAFGYCRCLRVCVCVCLSVNHELVRTITRQPFQLGSPNLDQRCKRPWLRSLLFWEVIDLDLQGQI